MRKVGTWCGVGVAALAVTGAAIAHGGGGGGAKSVASVAATFTATQVANARTTTCTNADGAWTRVEATYTGTSSGDPALTGAATLQVRSLVNTTKNLGLVSGTLRVGSSAKAGFEAVYSGGKLAGLAAGRTQDAKLLANVSASFSPTGGFTNGKLGATDAGGAAVAVTPGDCEQQAAQKATLHIEGTVVSASSAALVVKSGSDQITCSVSPGQAADVTKLQPGQSVAASCALAGGSYQLLALGRSAKDKEHWKRH